MSRSLVVNADDLGMSKGATLGIVRAHRDGIVTSASLAATAPAYEHAISACVQCCPDLGIGLHFSLTAGRPVSDSRAVPLLIDRDGFLRWRFSSLLSATAMGSRDGLLEQIELELEAQLQRLIADGVRPDHISSERHIHLVPGIFEKVVNAAERHHVPFIRTGRDLGFTVVRFGRALPVLLGGGLVKMGLLSSLAAVDRRRLNQSVRTSDYLASYAYTGRPDLFLQPLLAAQWPESVVIEVMVHPGMPEESGSVVLGNRELERYLTQEARRRELEICIEARNWTSGWTLTNFRELMPASRATC